jgi:hypothetical protein
MAAYGAGDYVKVELTDEATRESDWLWVRVERCYDTNRLVFGRGNKKAPFLTGRQQPWRLSRRSFGLSRQTHASRGAKPGYAVGTVAFALLTFAWAPAV